MSGRVVKVESWEAFRHLIGEYGPQKILYSIKKGAAEGQTTILSFTLPLESRQYVFTDTAEGDRLRETGIRLHKDERGNAYIRDEHVVDFVKSRISRRGVKLVSYWTQTRGRQKLGSAGVISLGHLPETTYKLAKTGEKLEAFEALMAKARALLEDR